MKLIKTIAILKNFLARSNGYLLLATFGLSLYNAVPSFAVFIPCLFLGVAGLLGLGYADYKLGVFREETLHASKQNPLMVEILKEVKRK